MAAIRENLNEKGLCDALNLFSNKKPQGKGAPGLVKSVAL